MRLINEFILFIIINWTGSTTDYTDKAYTDKIIVPYNSKMTYKSLKITHYRKLIFKIYLFQIGNKNTFLTSNFKYCMLKTTPTGNP